MNKILIELYVPALNASYDLLIPSDSRLYEVQTLVRRAVTAYSDGAYLAGEEAALCRREDGGALDVSLSARELGLYNGIRLMLF